MSRRCVNLPDSFCYICGEVTLKSQRKQISALVEEAYALYFGCKVGDQDKSWAPHLCCSRCARYLRGWLKGTHRSMPFSIPMIWREPKDHVSDCYFCLTKISGFTAKSKHAINYPNLPSAIRPVLHDDTVQVPISPAIDTLDSDSEDLNNEEPCLDNSEHLFQSTSEPHFLTQADLNDLARDLNLSKLQSELLGSRLQGWNLLEKDTKITKFRKRQNNLASYFSKSEYLVYCNDVSGLMAELGQQHNPDEWRLFIDSSRQSLKAVLIHIGNKKTSVPLAHSLYTKECYETMAYLLQTIKYEKYGWNICGDLKVISILLGMQKGFTKYCCFLCEWDSRDRKKHYVVREWPIRKSLVPGQKSVSNKPLVKTEKILLPPLHIKLGLMKNFVKAMNKDSEGFMYLRGKFPKTSDAKIKEGIFIGPEIRKVMLDDNFDEKLNDIEKSAWIAFKNVCHNFLGNAKSENYKDIVENMIQAYKIMGCNMSLKIHFLSSHLDFFPENLGAVSDEHGERFHQDISIIEKRYSGRCNPSMLADYCWYLIRENQHGIYKRKSGKKLF